MIATIGEARVRATTLISTAHPRDIFLILFFFIILFSSPNVNIACAILERGIVMVGVKEIVRGLVEALRVGQNACDFQHHTSMLLSYANIYNHVEKTLFPHHIFLSLYHQSLLFSLYYI